MWMAQIVFVANELYKGSFLEPEFCSTGKLETSNAQS